MPSQPGFALIFSGCGNKTTARPVHVIANACLRSPNSGVHHDIQITGTFHDLGHFFPADSLRLRGLPTPVKVSDGVLVGANGMTLYTFDKDAAGSGKSVCNGPCATNWPPLMAAPGEAASGDFSIITRDDGSKQWAVKGKPVYYWAKDSKPGDKTGDGFNNVWHVAKP